MGEMQIVEVVGKNVEAQFVEMMVPLYSYGCDKKIKNALANFKGIYSVNVDFHQQKVIVWGICDKYDVLSAVKSKRKGARFWDSSEDTNNNIQLHESHSEPSSPDRSSSLSKNYSTRHLAMAKVRSLNLSLSMMMKNKALNWKGLKKVFIRSNSF